MQGAGIIGEDENHELIEGESVPMQAETHADEPIKSALMIALARALPDRLRLGVESTIYLTDNTFLEPDLVVYPRGLELETVKVSDIALAIEVAPTSLAYDRELKARLYASHGVKGLWVIDADKRRTFVRAGPAGEAWASVTERGPDEAPTCEASPGLSVRLASI